ncbi:class II aldolase/adducin N-terminal [Fusarium tricinctum]|uniref:Class II aldolase/adducin N-terminal n=1 Tax=Fusarium tricinctum TaxID=61284 RepID=A0A8K0WBG0_9HYPO|nr:class II aldolase/adducin N-terminal [Fusarium tricinctum]
MAPTVVRENTSGALSFSTYKAFNSTAPTEASHTNHRYKLEGKTPLQALSHKVITLQGYVEGISGYISTNPLSIHFGLLKIRDIVLVNLDGEVISDNHVRPPNSAGFLIHASIHKAHPDVHTICYNHSIYGKGWSVFERRLEMLTRDACKFYGSAQGVYNGYGGLMLGSEEGDRITQALEPFGKGYMLRNHGLLTVRQTVDEAGFLFTSMETSCRVQLLANTAAISASIPKVLISDREAKFNFDVKGDPEVCYCEFQVYYDLEEQLGVSSFD